MALEGNITNLSLKEIASRKLHHGKNQFVNPFCDEKHGSFWRLLYWKLHLRTNYKDYYRQERTIPLSLEWKPLRKGKEIAITFIKHACVMIRDAYTNILVDPMFFGVFPGIKDFTPIVSGLYEMPKPHLLLITHGHLDHLSKKSLSILDKKTPIITPLGYKGLLARWGFNYITELDWFQTYNEGKIKVVLLPCNHWSMRNPLLGPNRSLWGSFLVETSAGVNIFISGDTAYFGGFKEIGLEYKIDIAIFCLGAYEPRWFMANSHISPPELVKAFLDLNANKLLIVHWGSFRLGDEPVFFPPKEITSQLSKAGLSDKFVPLSHGKTITFPR